jgi:hypothetical protein
MVNITWIRLNRYVIVIPLRQLPIKVSSYWSTMLQRTWMTEKSLVAAVGETGQTRAVRYFIVMFGKGDVTTLIEYM